MGWITDISTAGFLRKYVKSALRQPIRLAHLINGLKLGVEH
jgi:hypothetical protein